MSNEEATNRSKDAQPHHLKLKSGHEISCVSKCDSKGTYMILYLYLNISLTILLANFSCESRV